MRIVEPGYEIVVFHPEEDMKCIERAARLCYKSEVLRDARLAKRCYIKYERKQGCFHITTR